MIPQKNAPIPPLAPNHIHIWQFPLHADPSTLAAHSLLLSPDELQRTARFAFPDPRRRFIVARANLRNLLSHYTHRSPIELHFTYGPNEKPELANLNSPVHFNLSHSHDLALLAIATSAPVGIDLEQIRPLDHDAIARTILSESDQLTITQAPPTEKPALFFQLWVRHEARVKALGTRINSPTNLPTYDLDLGPDYRGALATPIKNIHIELFTLPLIASPASED